MKNEEINVSVPHIVQIPVGFKGKLRIVAFTSRHDGTAAINDKNDVILLDNFEIFDVVAADDEDLKTGFFISPNPSDDYTNIRSFGEKIEKIRLLDISGRPVLTYVFNGGISEMSLPLHSLPGGSYIAELTTTKQVFFTKIIRR